MNGYLYKITHAPTGCMYFGSRKTPEGISPDADEYMGSPTGSNKMRDLMQINPAEEFTKEILCVESYDCIADMENLLIKEAWEKFGKVHEGGLVTNLSAAGHYVITDEVRAKMSASLMGHTVSDETRDKMRSNNSGSGNPNYGKTTSDETKAKISASKSGEKNPMYGVPSPTCRSVTNVDTGYTFPSLKTLSDFLGINYSTVKARVRRNKWVWKYT